MGRMNPFSVQRLWASDQQGLQLAVNNYICTGRLVQGSRGRLSHLYMSGSLCPSTRGVIRILNRSNG